MSLFTDYLLRTYLYFRLGHQAQDDSVCVYVANVNSTPQEIRRSDLPAKAPGMKRFVIVSDTHEKHRCLGELPAGDIFIHAGDIFMSNCWMSKRRATKRLRKFNKWLGSAAVPCDTKIIVAGNHDEVLQQLGPTAAQEILTNATYLENCSTVAHSYCIWGSPSSSGKSFNKAFQTSAFREQALSSALQHHRLPRPHHGQGHEDLVAKTSEVQAAAGSRSSNSSSSSSSSSNSRGTSAPAVPVPPDIWVTHGPCFDVMQHVHRGADAGADTDTGSGTEATSPPPLLHVFGHVHGGRGVWRRGERLRNYTTRPALTVNAAIMDVRYQPHCHPVVVDLPERMHGQYSRNSGGGVV